MILRPAHFQKGGGRPAPQRKNVKTHSRNAPGTRASGGSYYFESVLLFDL